MGILRLRWRLSASPRPAQAEALSVLWAAAGPELDTQLGPGHWRQTTEANGRMTLCAIFADAQALEIFLGGPFMSELMARAPVLLCKAPLIEGPQAVGPGAP